MGRRRIDMKNSYSLICLEYEVSDYKEESADWLWIKLPVMDHYITVYLWESVERMVECTQTTISEGGRELAGFYRHMEYTISMNCGGRRIQHSDDALGLVGEIHLVDLAGVRKTALHEVGHFIFAYLPTLGCDPQNSIAEDEWGADLFSVTATTVLDWLDERDSSKKNFFKRWFS